MVPCKTTLCQRLPGFTTLQLIENKPNKNTLRDELKNRSKWAKRWRTGDPRSPGIVAEGILSLSGTKFVRIPWGYGRTSPRDVGCWPLPRSASPARTSKDSFEECVAPGFRQRRLAGAAAPAHDGRGVVERPDDPCNIAQWAGLRAAFRQRSRGLSLEVDDVDVAIGDQCLAEM